ncbi:MAG TPA: substrate-binding domain-containing protein [Tepidisphaeraceae bacterium]|nr:substrate-binding domain-containing protein [Tepidisphaeraceae bacterium]
MTHRGFSRMTLVFFGALAALGILTALLAWDGRIITSASARHGTRPLIIYCAAAAKEPVDVISRDYEKKFGVEIESQYGGSNTLLASAAISRKGDLFIPADDSYIAMARAKGIIAQAFPLAVMRPVLALKGGNPAGIRSLDDFLQPGRTLAQANPDAAAIGKLTRPVLQKAGLWEPLKRQTAVFTGTVTDAANDVKLGSVDGAIVWDMTVRQVGGLQAIPVPALVGVESRIAVGVLSFSTQSAEALRFAHYVTASDKGLRVFAQLGYNVVQEPSSK